MADTNTSNSKDGDDTKNKKSKNLVEVPTDNALLSDKKSALVGEEDCLYYEKGLELSYKQPNEIKYETDVLSEMDNTAGIKSSTPKILKTTSVTTSTPANITVKKETVSDGKAVEKSLSKVPAYLPTPIKPAMAVNIPTDEVNSHESGNRVSAGAKKKGKVIRLSAKDLSDEERKKLRAKRFNIIVADFSQNDKVTIKSPNQVYQRTSSLTNKPTPTFQILKKRAERFGENVSTVMKSLDNKEKMLKRKLKFLESVTNLKELDVKKRRAERFRVV